ncbi:MAG: MerR family DNA-binding transcriptional regulator, partial [bacterium]|nr:MerR family DNA-binding transcriptional regulator [bacterium]
MTESELISIGDAAKKLGISQQTLRRWDAQGLLQSVRASMAGNRYYHRQVIEDFLRKKTMKLFYAAENWASNQVGSEPDHDFYCQNSGVFKARIDKMEILLMRTHGLEQLYSII